MVKVASLLAEIGTKIKSKLNENKLTRQINNKKMHISCGTQNSANKIWSFRQVCQPII